jgi:hypothetical protein
MISRAGSTAVYGLGGLRYGIVISQFDGRQREITANAEICSAVTSALVGEGILYAQGEFPIIRTKKGKVIQLATSRHEQAFVMENFMLASSDAAELPARLKVPTELQTLSGDDPFAEWNALCRGNDLRRLEWYGSGASLAPALRSCSVPKFLGELHHPIVGTLPNGWFAPSPPSEPENFDLLLELFSSLPLDAASRATLYTYLLACFHADSITNPAPLLCLDSGEQAVGKTEAMMAVASLIDEETVPVTPPYSKDTEVLTAYFIKQCRIAPLDNLCSVKDYQHPWLASVLSDRNVADRPKYGRTTIAFPGRLVAVTFILGNATLHRDFLSRAWRVELHGHGKPLTHRPNWFARENKAALRAQCYHAVAQAPEWNARGSGTRSSEFEARGAAAYAHITGKSQEEVSNLLRESLQRVSGYSTAFLRSLKKVGAEFAEPDTVLPVQAGDPKGSQIAYLAGATGLGFRAVRTEKGIDLEPYTPEVEQL